MPLAKAPINPPNAKIIPMERKFHEDTYTDNYEWLREKDNPEVIAYLEAENEYYQKTITPLEPTIKTLVEELRSHTKENDAGLPVAREKWWYWKATRKGEQYPRYFRCPRSIHPKRPESSYDLEKAPTGTQLVLDCNAKAKGQDFFSLLTLSISPNEKLLAIGIDNSGDEYYNLEIIEIETGLVIDKSVQGITGGLIWSQDSKYLYYTTANNAWRSYQVWQHRVPENIEINAASQNYHSNSKEKPTNSTLTTGEPENNSKLHGEKNTQNNTEDILIFQENNEQYEVEIDKTSPGDYLLIQSYSPLTSEINILPLDIKETIDDKTYTHQCKNEIQAKTNIADKTAPPSTENYLHPEVITVFPRKHGLIYGVQSQGDHFILVHNANNQDFEIAYAPVGSSTPSRWQTIYRAKPGERINEVISFQGALAISMRSQALETVKILPRILEEPKPESTTGNKNKTQTGIQINSKNNIISANKTNGIGNAPLLKYPPIYGEIIDIKTTGLPTIEPYQNYLWETDTMLVETQSLVQPPTILEISLKNGNSLIKHQQEIPGLKTDEYVSWREWATTTDGTKIPITLARKKNINPGNNPGLLYGYGAYEICSDPIYVDHWISLMDRGFICAIAHIRGGGELGRKWYLDGRELNKRNSFTDFIACADHLIQNGWVGAERLAASGGSAGGLLMGAVANMGGERFRAISAHVPFVDALTTILKPELPLTAGEWEEWGNPITNKSVYNYMKSYSPYENITAKEYPALMITTSYNDIRVLYVEPTKWVAKLRKFAINKENKPIIYHCEMVAGHAGKTGRYNQWRKKAEELAFILDQLEAI